MLSRARWAAVGCTGVPQRRRPPLPPLTCTRASGSVQAPHSGTWGPRKVPSKEVMRPQAGAPLTAGLLPAGLRTRSAWPCGEPRGTTLRRFGHWCWPYRGAVLAAAWHELRLRRMRLPAQGSVARLASTLEVAHVAVILYGIPALADQVLALLGRTEFL